MDVHAGEHGSEKGQSGVQRGVARCGHGAAGDAFHEEGEHLVIGERAAVPVAEFSCEAPEVHGEVPIRVELAEKCLEVFRGSGLDAMHLANHTEFSRVSVERFRLVQKARVARHHDLLDANRRMRGGDAYHRAPLAKEQA